MRGVEDWLSARFTFKIFIRNPVDYEISSGKSFESQEDFIEFRFIYFVVFGFGGLW
ncbi:hypothetical protein D3C77_651820 [compost metagenome]